VARHLLGNHTIIRDYYINNKLDYEKDGFDYDVRQQGWIIGLTWAF